MRWARSHSTAARPVRPHWHLPLVQVRRTSIRVPLLLMRVRRWHAGQTPGFSGSVWTPLTFTVSQVYVRLESFLSRPEGGHRCRAFTRSDCVAASERLALVSTMLSSRTTATTAREGTPREGRRAFEPSATRAYRPRSRYMHPAPEPADGSATAEEFGFLGLVIAGDQLASRPLNHELFGWRPAGPAEAHRGPDQGHCFAKPA